MIEPLPNDMTLPPGMLIIARGAIGVPYIVRVQGDGTWLCVAGVFSGRHWDGPTKSRRALAIIEEGDVIEDLGLVARGGELVKVVPK